MRAGLSAVSHDAMDDKRVFVPCDGGDKLTQGAGEDDDPKTYLTALRKVVEARGGIASTAEKAQLSRETLYRTLSTRVNPTIRTLNAVLKATGLKFGVTVH